ncbi:hypothetical protein C8J56DRAFT_1052079 [Mycena floridula]|nr:hypothetical protein C8J56DRAFT_1052079 [Mycena floridula]
MPTSQIYYILDDTDVGAFNTGPSKWVPAQDTAYFKGTSTWDQANELARQLHPQLVFSVSPRTFHFGNRLALILLLVTKTVIVDDDYANIQYVGHWQTSKGQQLQGPWGDDDREPAWAFQNATHETTTPGDYLQFGYTGTNLTLYGVFPWNQPGTYRFTVSVDGGTPLPFQFSSLAAAASGPQINFPLFTTGKLDAGDHTILVNLTECDSSTLIVDYIAYEPSFSSWSTMPNISLPSLGSQGTTTFPGAATGNTTPVTTSGSKKTPVGAIAGGVVGAWVLLTLLGLFLFWRRKYQRKEKPSAFTDQRDPGSFLREKDVPPGQEAYTVSHPAYIATSKEAEVEASKSSPKSVYSEKGSVTLSYRPFSSASIDSSSSVVAGGSSSTVQDRSEIRRRIMELERLVEESEAKEDEESPALTQMKERIQMLTQENERLASLAEAPPSYIASDSGASSTAGDVKGNNSVLRVV